MNSIIVHHTQEVQEFNERVFLKTLQSSIEHELERLSLNFLGKNLKFKSLLLPADYVGNLKSSSITQKNPA